MRTTKSDTAEEIATKIQTNMWRMAESREAPDRGLLRREALARFRAMLSWMAPADERTLRMRFGIGEAAPMDYPAIAEYFGVTEMEAEERVARAISRLARQGDPDSIELLSGRVVTSELRGLLQVIST